MRSKLMQHLELGKGSGEQDTSKDDGGGSIEPKKELFKDCIRRS